MGGAPGTYKYAPHKNPMGVPVLEKFWNPPGGVPELLKYGDPHYTGELPNGKTLNFSVIWAYDRRNFILFGR